MVWPTEHIQQQVPINEPNHPVIHVAYDIMGIMLSMGPQWSFGVLLTCHCRFSSQDGLVGEEVMSRVQIVKLVSRVPMYCCTPHILCSIWIRVNCLCPLHYKIFIVVVNQYGNIGMVFTDLWPKILFDVVSFCLWCEMHCFVICRTITRFVLNCDSPNIDSFGCISCEKFREIQRPCCFVLVF